MGRGGKQRAQLVADILARMSRGCYEDATRKINRGGKRREEGKGGDGGGKGMYVSLNFSMFYSLLQRHNTQLHLIHRCMTTHRE